MRTERILINDGYSNPTKLTSEKGVYVFLLPENMAAVFGVLIKASLCDCYDPQQVFPGSDQWSAETGKHLLAWAPVD